MLASKESKTRAEVQKRAIWYNQTVNVLWSIVSFTPIGYFCFAAMDLKWLFILLAVSLSAGFLPRTFFDAMQLGKTTSIYEKIGIRFAKKYTQDGDVINGLIRRKAAQYKVFDGQRSIQKHLNKAYAIEKVHFVMFLFFLLTSIYALWHGYFGWAVVITFNNLIFNLYPNFLQQYNRIRLRHLMSGHPSKQPAPARVTSRQH